MCSKHIILFSKNSFKFGVIIKNGKEVDVLNVDEYELYDGDSKIEAIQKEVDLKSLV